MVNLTNRLYSAILNFVICSDDDDDDDLFPSDEADDSESDDGMSFFEEEETKSRFTNYSMTSSVVRRNEGLDSKQIITLTRKNKT